MGAEEARARFSRSKGLREAETQGSAYHLHRACSRPAERGNRDVRIQHGNRRNQTAVIAKELMKAAQRDGVMTIATAECFPGLMTGVDCGCATYIYNFLVESVRSRLVSHTFQHRVACTTSCQHSECSVLQRYYIANLQPLGYVFNHSGR